MEQKEINKKLKENKELILIHLGDEYYQPIENILCERKILKMAIKKIKEKYGIDENTIEEIMRESFNESDIKIDRY